MTDTKDVPREAPALRSSIDEAIKSIETLSFGTKGWDADRVEHNPLKWAHNYLFKSEPTIVPELAYKLGVPTKRTIKLRRSVLGNYGVINDNINLRPYWNLKTLGDYVHTYLHELMHWTGAPSRLDRDFPRRALGLLSDAEMAKEELIASFGTAMLEVAFNQEKSCSLNLSIFDAAQTIMCEQHELPGQRVNIMIASLKTKSSKNYQTELRHHLEQAREAAQEAAQYILDQYHKA